MKQDILKMFSDPKVVEALKKGGHISDDTYKQVKKYSSGGQVEIPQVDLSNEGIQNTVQAVGQNNFEATKNEYLKNQGVVPGSQDPYAKAMDSKATEFALNKIAGDKQAHAINEAKAQAKSQADAEQAQSQIEKMKSLGLQPDAGLLSKVDAAKQNTAVQSGTTSEGAPEPGQFKVEKVQAQPNQDFAAKSFGSAVDSMNKGYNLEAKGISDAAKAGQAEGEATGKFLQTVTDKMNQVQENQQKIEADRQSRLQTQMDKLDSMNQEYLKSASIDPNRFWSSRTTGQKIMAGIGIALGGVGLQNGGNAAMDVIKDAINRDIDAQKADVEKKKFGIESQQNIYKDMLSQFQDSRTAEAATRAQMLSIAEMQLKQIAASHQGAKVQAEAEKALGELSMNKAKAQQEMMQFYRTSAAFQGADDTSRKIMGLPKEMQEEAWKEKGEYDKHQQTVKGVQDAMRDMYQYSSSLVPGSQGYSRWEAAKTKIKSLTSELFGGKSEAEFKIIEGLLPKPLDSKETFNRKMDMITQKLHSQASFPRLKGLGILPRDFDLRRN